MFKFVSNLVALRAH